MKLIGIETSCDETAASVVADGTKLLSNVVASQSDLHARYGGVVPEVASRQHLEAITGVVTAALADAACTWDDIEAIAVTNGPGLAGSLLVGVNAAKAIAYARSLPLIGINHLEAHIYANWLGVDEPPELPALCLIVSGGHSDIVMMEEHGRYRRLGGTRDDAAGEAFDKVARLLGLGFPGGPAIEREAKLAASNTLTLPRAWLKGGYDYSFSGLKTAVLRLIRDEANEAPPRAEIALAFQEAVSDVLVAKTVDAASRQRAASIILAGGVAANGRLRALLRERSSLPVHVPPPALCTDNGAMVAGCAYFRLSEGIVHDLSLDIAPGMQVGLS